MMIQTYTEFREVSRFDKHPRNSMYLYFPTEHKLLLGCWRWHHYGWYICSRESATLHSLRYDSIHMPVCCTWGEIDNSLFLAMSGAGYECKCTYDPLEVIYHKKINIDSVFRNLAFVLKANGRQ